MESKENIYFEFSPPYGYKDLQSIQYWEKKYKTYIILEI